MKISRAKIRISDLLEYGLMFVIIFYGQTVWLRALDVDYDLLINLAVAITAVLIVMQKSVKKRYFQRAGILLLILLFYMAITRNRNAFIFQRILLPLVVFTVYLCGKYEKGELFALFKRFSDIMVALSAISVVLYVFGSLLHLLPYHYTTYYWAGMTQTAKGYFHLLYETQTEEFFGIRMVRNSGIFCEAPSYAVPLILSLFYESFFPQSISKKRVAILSAAILTSFSAKAILIACIVFGLKVIHYAYVNRSPNRYRQIVRLFVPIAVVVLAVTAVSVFDQKTDTVSFISRMDNLNSTMTAWRSHKLFGVGIGNEAAITAFSVRAQSLRWKGFSIGAPLLLAQGGIYMAAFYLGGLLNALIQSKNKWTVLSFGIVHFALLMSSNIPYFLSTIFILAAEYVVQKPRILASKSQLYDRKAAVPTSAGLSAKSGTDPSL